ncbi:hypothetical protein, partial [Pseudoalteromonas luteoviolacea]|uniref:hypothetical protein n=1 Tax=Pseudoalteromonas luteoviolacea TaxID=43657 RepID=UPI000B152C10
MKLNNRASLLLVALLGGAGCSSDSSKIEEAPVEQTDVEQTDVELTEIVLKDQSLTLEEDSELKIDLTSELPSGDTEEVTLQITSNAQSGRIVGSYPNVTYIANE